MAVAAGDFDKMDVILSLVLVSVMKAGPHRQI